MEVTDNKPTTVDIKDNKPTPLDVTDNKPASLDVTDNKPASLDVTDNNPASLDVTYNNPASLDVTENKPTSLDGLDNKPTSLNVSRSRQSQLESFKYSPLWVRILIGQVETIIYALASLFRWDLPWNTEDKKIEIISARQRHVQLSIHRFNYLALPLHNINKQDAYLKKKQNIKSESPFYVKLHVCLINTIFIILLLLVDKVWRWPERWESSTDEIDNHREQ